MNVCGEVSHVEKITSALIVFSLVSAMMPLCFDYFIAVAVWCNIKHTTTVFITILNILLHNHILYATKCKHQIFYLIEANNLHGTLPLELKELTFLRFLFVEGEKDEDQEEHDYDVSKDYISGTIPSGLGSLQGLQTLNLNFNKLSGTVSMPTYVHSPVLV